MAGGLVNVDQVVDGGFQRSFEAAADRVAADQCWRCQRFGELSTSGLCAPCRSFLVGAGPDPVVVGVPVAALAAVVAEQARPTVDRITIWLAGLVGRGRGQADG